MVTLPLLFGLVIGSFLNVVIVRLPEGKSVLRPRSACPGCATPIAWYDNVPLLSFARLRGRCRACGMAIPWRYPIVEAATGALFALAYMLLGPTPDFVVAVAFLAALIAITAIDLSHQIIPDVITLPGIPAGVVASLATGRVTWLESLLGIAVGGGIFLVIILASRGGMGGGDMKLGAMLGAFLGWKLGLLAILLGVLAGGLVAVCLLMLGRKGRKEAIPFGPFLALGGAVTFLWGNELLAWYLGHFLR
jgi:leader peptidase (prepilin peptidase) / N-methyltransferase